MEFCNMAAVKMIILLYVQYIIVSFNNLNIIKKPCVYVNVIPLLHMLLPYLSTQKVSYMISKF